MKHLFFLSALVMTTTHTGSFLNSPLSHVQIPRKPQSANTVPQEKVAMMVKKPSLLSTAVSRSLRFALGAGAGFIGTELAIEITDRDSSAPLHTRATPLVATWLGAFVLDAAITNQLTDATLREKQFNTLWFVTGLAAGLAIKLYLEHQTSSQQS